MFAYSYYASDFPVLPLHYLQNGGTVLIAVRILIRIRLFCPITWSRPRESNPNLKFRKLSLCPLNYTEKIN